MVKALAQKIRFELKDKVNLLKEKNIQPKLAVIMVGGDSSSKYMYVIKAKLVRK